MGDLLLALFILAFSAFIAGAETAFFHLSPTQRDRVKEIPLGHGHRVAELLTQPRQMVLTFLILNEAANLALAAHLSLLAAETFTPIYAFAGAAVSVFLVLIFAETLPKSIALAYPVTYVRQSVPILWHLHRGITPFRHLILAIADAILLPTGSRPWGLPTRIKEDELKYLIDIGQRSGALAKDEREMILNVFEFGDTLVRELMTPRTDMLAFPIDTPLPKLLAAIQKARLARVPIYGESPDKVLGVLYTKDLLRWRMGTETPHNNEGQGLSPLLHEALFVPETMQVDDLLRQFQNKRIHMAMVIDEYGGIRGLITLDDLLEELFGELLDEWEATPQESIKESEKGVYEVQGNIEIETLNQLLGLTLPEDPDYSTLAGYVLELLGHLPKEGHSLQGSNCTIKVIQVLDSRVTLLEVTPHGEKST